MCGEGSTRLGVYDLYEEHNEGWEVDNTKCPMYLNEIHPVDDRWSCEDVECMDMFHRKRTIKLLIKFIEEIGIETYRKLSDIFL